MAPARAGQSAAASTGDLWPIRDVRAAGKLSWQPLIAAGGDPAKEEQIHRYQDAATKQQAELDRVTSQAKRMGCDSSGFFSLFNGQSAQCGPVNNQIPADACQPRSDHDQPGAAAQRRAGRQRTRKISAARSSWRWRRITHCGPQYANAVQQGPGDFLNNLFGNNSNNPVPCRPPVCRSTIRHLSHGVCPAPATERISRSRLQSVPARFSRRRTDLQGALSRGRSESLCLPKPRRRHEPGRCRSAVNLIRPRPTRFVSARSSTRRVLVQGTRTDVVGCAQSDRRQSRGRTAGQSIIVTEESAKKMSRPQAKRDARARRRRHRRGGGLPRCRPVDDTGAAEHGLQPLAPLPLAPLLDNKPIRSVGPTFIPARENQPSNSFGRPRGQRARPGISSGLGSGLPSSRNLLVMG